MEYPSFGVITARGSEGGAYFIQRKNIHVALLYVDTLAIGYPSYNKVMIIFMLPTLYNYKSIPLTRGHCSDNEARCYIPRM